MALVTTEHGFKIEFNQEKHVYIHNGEYVVGMSTLLGKLASPMLENWKISQQVNAIKTEMEIQFKDLFNRVKRLEAIMIGTSGFIIVLLLRMNMIG